MSIRSDHRDVAMAHRPRLLGPLIAVLMALAGLSGVPAYADDVVPLARAHAHNDYLHDRPLLDALDSGFTSVEADVWLVDGKLLVAHDFVEVSPYRTLQSLYLGPLRERVKANGGSVYAGDEDTFQLLIDIKSDGAATYLAVHRTLRRYQSMLTTFTPGGANGDAVTAVISGNRPRELMLDQRVRYAAYDGRLSDLNTDLPASFIPLISDRWTSTFTWQGVGPMPAAEAERLREIVAEAHADGRRVRFWATPDELPNREAVWTELLDAQVDYINTDHLEALQDFLLANDPHPSTPYVEWWESRYRSAA